MEQEQILKTINIQLSQGQIKWLDDNKGSESRSCLLRLIVNEKMDQETPISRVWRQINHQEKE